MMNSLKSNRNRSASAVGKILTVVLCAFLAFNQLLIINIKTRLGMSGYLSGAINSLFYPEKKNGFVREDIKLAGNIQDDAKAIIMITGEPYTYGKELNVSFDRIQESIDVMKKYDPRANSFSKIDNARYSNVTGKISCEFCCTVESLTYRDGKPTCDCDHAKAMRGLAAYLIKNHGNTYTDNEILTELARWKGVYFPKQMTGKLMKQIRSGTYTYDVDAILTGIKLPKYDFKNENLDETENVPDMVGGC